MALSADKAREITRKALSEDSENLKPYIQDIDLAIANAAHDGKNSITLWPVQESKRQDYHHFSSVIVPALRKHYAKQGFEVEYHDNPDPGHPASSDYETMSW